MDPWQTLYKGCKCAPGWRMSVAHSVEEGHLAASCEPSPINLHKLANPVLPLPQDHNIVAYNMNYKWFLILMYAMPLMVAIAAAVLFGVASLYRHHMTSRTKGQHVSTQIPGVFVDMLGHPQVVKAAEPDHLGRLRAYLVPTTHRVTLVVIRLDPQSLSSSSRQREYPVRVEDDFLEGCEVRNDLIDDLVECADTPPSKGGLINASSINIA
jgi:hypothetical protein